MKGDPLIDDVRKARHEISEQYEHDLWKLYAHYKSEQDRLKALGKIRLITSPTDTAHKDKTA